MSEEMAVGDNAISEETNVNAEEASIAGAIDTAEAVPEPPAEALNQPSEETPENNEASKEEKQEVEKKEDEDGDHRDENLDVDKNLDIDKKLEADDNIPVDEIVAEDENPDVQKKIDIDEKFEIDTIEEIKKELEEKNDADDKQMEMEKVPEVEIKEEKRGIKRRASAAFSDGGENEFKGFDFDDQCDLTEGYSKVLERLEAEVTAASKEFTPVRVVMATPPAPARAIKRQRQDTDGSRPSSALSSRSDGDGVGSTDALSTASSPAQRGRRATVEMSSPLLRVPLDRGWKRELVHRAALDAYSRRNADIYYYTPQGKKLRSTREVAEHLHGTGLTLENFSFFKEPLGVDDPEKEIIRDAKMMRRVESPVPVAAPAPLDAKRTPKPKPPKGASPEPTPKSPPAKLKVKSMGSRLSASTPTAAAKKKVQQQSTPSATENNNTAAWKKPKLAAGGAAPLLPLAPLAPQADATPAPLTTAPPAPPPLQSRPHASTELQQLESRRRVIQPCSMTCGRGVPSLACAGCLCLYHPACAGHDPDAEYMLCKNCRTSPPVDPPPLTHKSGVTGTARTATTTTPAQAQPSKRVLLRMKVSGGGPDGEKVWAVTKPQPPPAVAPPPAAAPPPPPPVPPPPPPPKPTAAPPPPRAAHRPTLPQSIVVLNGRRFILVPRSMVQPTQQLVLNLDDDKRRTRIANGAVSPPAPLTSPRRRGRPRADDTDHFTAFYNAAHERSYNVVVQIFQYLGMRDLAHCARVCKLWQQLAATPALWRHVRMKNSHVSDWGGLCAALKRHGTKRLDLRKMLLPQTDNTKFWEQFANHIPTVDTLERIEMCRCPASAIEAVCRVSGLRSLSALAIRDALLDPTPLGALPLLHELRLKSMSGLSLTRDLRPLAALTRLQHLSLTSIKELGWCACDVIGQLTQLESLELGECTFRAEFGHVLAKLTRLRRLRLERGTAQCAAPALLRALAALPHLTRLELVNVDVKVGFDDALAECKNIQRLLIIPTYVSQSATTNKQVLSGVLRLKDTLTHLMWGVTIELLRVTELFIDQCDQGQDTKKKDIGECIPVLKPVPGCKLPDHHHHVAGPPQVEILPLPTLQRLLSAQLPNTKLKLLRIPFHATWRQSLADFQ